VEFLCPFGEDLATYLTIFLDHHAAVAGGLHPSWLQEVQKLKSYLNAAADIREEALFCF